jgi:peptidoglycan/LPS O-acetylase OafA/YrhL
MKERARTGTIHLPAFYARRVLRIWPLYFSFLAFGVVIGYFVPGWSVSFWRIGAFLLLAGNWYTGFAGFTNNPISPLWSVSVEEQFYLLMPPIARYFGSSVLLGVSLGSMAFSYIALWWLCAHRAIPLTIWTNSIVQFQFFGAGCVLAMLLGGKSPKLKLNSRLAMFACAGVSWYFASRLGVNSGTAKPATFVCAGYMAMLIGSVLFFLAFLGTTLGIPAWIRYLGKISYGLYVYHMLMLSLIEYPWAKGRVSSLCLAALSLAATILTAAVSYRFLETPFLRLKKRFTFVPSRVL